MYENLHRRMQKPVIERILTTLSAAPSSTTTTASELQCKEYGKAKIYYYNQSKLSEYNSVSDKQLEDMDTQISNLNKEVDILQHQYKKTKHDMELLQSQPNDIELDE